MFTIADAYALAGPLVLVVTGAIMGFACIPRDLETGNVGCSAMWHKTPMMSDPTNKSAHQGI